MYKMKKNKGSWEDRIKVTRQEKGIKRQKFIFKWGIKYYSYEYGIND